jgi:hypothetical protein
MNEWVLRSTFPSFALEFIDDWRDRAEMGKAFVYERVLLADRSAAMLSYNFLRFQRTAASAFAIPASPSWWSPIRNNVVAFAGINPAVENTTTPVITYISRQGWGRRMLIPADHEKLVQELYKLRDKYGYEVNVVNLEKMSRVEQIRLAARTTVSTCPICFFQNANLFFLDYDGCARKRSHLAGLDETHSTINRHRILLSSRFCT